MNSTLQISPAPKRWSRSEFYKLLDLGFFDEERVELVEGTLLVSPRHNNLHSVAIALTDAQMKLPFGFDHWIRIQMSLDLNLDSVLDPDLAVIRGSVRQNVGPDNPTFALLVVEVSDTTLRYDRTRKASVYAKAGIADYWILNIVDQQLEVHRSPVADSAEPYGYGYSEITILTPKESVSPLAAPQARMLVADLLP